MHAYIFIDLYPTGYLLFLLHWLSILSAIWQVGYREVINHVLLLNISHQFSLSSCVFVSQVESQVTSYLRRTT